MHLVVVRGNVDHQRCDALDFGGVREWPRLEGSQSVDFVRERADRLVGGGVVADDQRIEIELDIEVGEFARREVVVGTDDRNAVRSPLGDEFADASDPGGW